VLRVNSHEVCDDPAQLLSGVLLQEVAGVVDGWMAEASGAGDELSQDGAIAPVIGPTSLNGSRNGSSQAESTPPRGEGRLAGGIVRAGGYQTGHGSGTGLGELLGEGRVVGRADLVGHRAHAASGDQATDVEQLIFSTARRNCHQTSGMSMSLVGSSATSKARHFAARRTSRPGNPWMDD